jgi:phosphotransferase system HPr-like phosphotransfer protein
MLARVVDHFVVTHSLGMHARVCSRWIKKIQALSPNKEGDSSEWIWIRFNNQEIPADSLFRLLESRIRCGTQFDLILDQRYAYDENIGRELAFIISQDAFEKSEMF